jgi:hypothetical protein
VSPTIDDFRQAVQASGLRGYARAILLLYASCFDQDCAGTGRTFVTRERLRGWTGCSLHTLTRVMQRLRDDGWLVPVPDAGAYRNHAPRYHLAVPGVGVVAPTSKPERVAKMDTLSPVDKGSQNGTRKGGHKGVQKGSQKGSQNGYPSITNDKRLTTTGAGSRSITSTSTRAVRSMTDHEQDDAAMALSVEFMARLPEGARLRSVHPRAFRAFRGLAAAGWTADQLVTALDADPGINPHRCGGGLIVQWLEAQCQRRPPGSSYRQPPLVSVVRDSGDTTPPEAVSNGSAPMTAEVKAVLAELEQRRRAAAAR